MNVIKKALSRICERFKSCNYAFDENSYEFIGYNEEYSWFRSPNSLILFSTVNQSSAILAWDQQS